MSRKQKVKDSLREILDEGKRPSAALLAEKLSWPEEDVHRCLNALEKERELETYKKEVLGQRFRMVALKR